MKCLMVGLGSIGQRHLRNLRLLKGDEVEISAWRVRRSSQVLTDQMTIESDTGLEEKYGLRVFDNLDAALREKPDAVFICNPNSMHIPVALAAAEAGCHLFLEKPLSHNFDGVDRLLEVMAGKNLVGLVGFQLRYHPCVNRLRELLLQGTIGRVISVRAEMGEYMPGWHPYEDYRQAYAARADQGGGSLLSQIHEIDYLYWLFGMPRRLVAMGGHLSSLEMDVEDIASVLMECTVDGRPIPVHLQLDYLQRPPSRTCHVVGNDGKIVVDLREPSLKLFDDKGQLVEHATFEDFQRNQLFLDETNHFLACLERRETPIVSVEDGARSLRIALAAKESLATGRQVELE